MLKAVLIPAGGISLSPESKFPPRKSPENAHVKIKKMHQIHPPDMWSPNAV